MITKPSDRSGPPKSSDDADRIQTTDELFAQFAEKIHSISADLTRAFNLKHAEFHDHLSSPILRWLDFRLRYIDPRPRMVLFSDQFPKILPLDIEGSMLGLAKHFLRGDDINAHQGRGLTDFDDISGKNRTRRTDLLWADWGIHHLHISRATKGDGYAARSDWLLFCVVLEDQVLFLDALPHMTQNFSSPDLVETLFRNWPEVADRHKLVGMMGGQRHSAEDIAAARKCGLALIVSYKGESYLGPGLGVSSASTPMRVTMTMDHCMHNARILAEEVLRPESQFRTESTARGIAVPKFELALSERGLSIFENHSNVAWPLPRRADRTLEYAGILHDNILPKWAMKCFV